MPHAVASGAAADQLLRHLQAPWVRALRMAAPASDTAAHVPFCVGPFPVFFAPATTGVDDVMLLRHASRMVHAYMLPACRSAGRSFTTPAALAARPWSSCCWRRAWTRTHGCPRQAGRLCVSGTGTPAWPYAGCRTMYRLRDKVMPGGRARGVREGRGRGRAAAVRKARPAIEAGQARASSARSVLLDPHPTPCPHIRCRQHLGNLPLPDALL